MKFSLATIAALVASVSAEIYFKEQFNDKGWSKRWKEPSKWKPKAEMGKWEHTAGKWYADVNDLGIQTSEDARFYGLSAPLEKTYTSSPDKPLIIQYSVKMEQDIDCGGAYIKLLPGGKKFDANKFGGDSPYAIMFGPDFCGTSNRKTHVILHSFTKDENLLINKEVPAETDRLTHVFTLMIKPDNTFEVFIDQKSVREGKLEDEFDFSAPKQIKDPDAKKPEDWVDKARIPDETDIKPEGYDDIPKEIADPTAEKPDDWDEEDDGEWEAPMLKNPDYKGEWKPKMIDNPDYKGKWEHPMIDNPDYKIDEEMYMVCKEGCTHVGFELWQVKTGTVFDDILVTDSLEEAQEFAKETYLKKKADEKAMYDKVQAIDEAEKDGTLDDLDDLDSLDSSDGVDGAFDEF